MAENIERSDLEEDVVVNHKRINEERDSQESAATELPKLMPEENMKPPHLKEAVANRPVSRIAPWKGTRRRSSMAGGIRHHRRLPARSLQGEQDTDRANAPSQIFCPQIPSHFCAPRRMLQKRCARIRAKSSLADGYGHLHNRRPNKGHDKVEIMTSAATTSNTSDVPSPSRNDDAKRKRATSPSLADGDDAPFQEQAKPKPDDAPFQEQAKPKPDCSKEHAT